MAIGTNPSGGTLTGTTSVTASAGVAAFSQLRIDKAGTGYTLIASSAGLTPATSNAFNITVGAWSDLLVQASGGGNIGTQSQGTAFNIQVAAADACLNAVTTYARIIPVGNNQGTIRSNTYIGRTKPLIVLSF